MAKIFRMKFWNKCITFILGDFLRIFVLPVQLRSACALRRGSQQRSLAFQRGSIGEKLYNAKIYLETPDLFAWTFVIIAVSVLFEKIFQWLLSLLAHRLSVK